ncbi:methyltransferase domain-containing protein [Paenibacillus pabuli]|uniref:methyltransferase domain-containing protein n=1 Tax=Paenibacillus pabuli TaxID=1472 RepID=UPI0007846E47|nr:methyltransferase domain-containing protein [Paenibacillus pabuli]MEC0127770.1 methyltransferase domain-containing protein [Paenibacillus pabuli]
MKNKSIDEYPYKFEYAFDNVYGHVVSLLGQFDFPQKGVHLDIGCGWGAISDELISNHNLHYIGVDADQDAVNHLQSEGKEAYTYQLSSYNANLEFFNRILNGRNISSISIIDTFEHVLYLEELLQTISTLSKNHQAPVVISVPNFAHDDVVFKLLCNKFDETNTGLLDETHINIFTEEKLIESCGKFGLHQINKKDVVIEKSDQHFPKELLTLAEKSSLRQLLINLRSNMKANGKVNQLVRMFIATHPSQVPVIQQERPFLSIVTRTVGDRPEELKEVLLCLTGQECTDFEVLVVGHNLTLENQLLVEGVINDTPEWIRSKIRLLRVNGGNRSAPLNTGFEHATGQYITILDDDDIVFSNWVEEFKNLSDKNYGKILKSVSVRQEYEQTKTEFSKRSSRAVSGFLNDYPAEFDFITMLHHNQCPGLCLAFPRSIFHDFGLRFDETINTIEDWDFIVRSAFICGVASSNVVTNIYRWWLKGANSQSLHNEQEWEDNYRYVQNKFNSQYLIMPPGNAKRIAAMVGALSESQNKSYGLPFTLDDQLALKRQIAHHILVSNSWNLTKPLRVVKRILGKKTCVPELFSASEAELDEFITNAQNSKSWKLTRVFRSR